VTVLDIVPGSDLSKLGSSQVTGLPCPAVGNPLGNSQMATVRYRPASII
jgi:hypothetical protein